MTPEPMSDEKWQEINNTTTMYGNDALSEEDFNAVLDEVRRLKAAQVVPPDVLAAMEEYRRGCCMDSNALTIAAHFVSHHGKDGT